MKVQLRFHNVIRFIAKLISAELRVLITAISSVFFATTAVRTAITAVKTAAAPEILTRQ